MTKQRKSWLARKFLMKRTSAISEFGLEADIEALANNSTQVAFLDPSEFQQGDQIGQGEYSLIYSIQGFCLEDSNTSKHNNNNNNNKLSPEEAAAATEMRKRREQIKEGALTNGPEQFILKKFNKKYLKDKATLKRGAVKLITEARVLGMLQGETTHSVTLKAMNLDVLDGIRDFENFFLLTDRLNDTLANRIDCWRKESIDKGEAPNDDRIPMKSNYAYQIAKAVKACHDNGIMIRDLTPSKIGFKDRHTVQLFGLGNSKIVGTEGGDSATDDDSSAPLVGCRRYMDGHIWMTGEYLFKSDVYSWAVIFYEMISEIPPYQGLSSLEHQQLVCAQGQRPSLNTCYVPPVVDTILTEAWDPKISKRINSTQVCDKMQRFLLELDSCYYEQNEEDFLLDIEVKEETVSNFADDKWFEGSEDDNETRFGNSSMRTLDLIHDDSSSAYTGGTGAHDSSAELKISKSKLSDASSYTTFASSVKATKPKRVVSSAA